MNPLLRVLHVEHGEENQVWLLLGQGFFMGIFIATYRIASQTIFLNTLGEKYLAPAILVSGALGIFTTATFTVLQSRVGYSRLVLFNLILIAAFSTGMWFLLDTALFRYVVFALFVMMWPITAVLLLSFWGIFGRLFTLKQSKRIIGGIDTGQLSGTILSFLAIPLLTQLPLFQDARNLLFIGSSSLLLSFVFVFIIRQQFDIEVVKNKPERKSVRSRINLFFKNNYVVLLSLFLIFSMLAYSFVEYSYLTVTGQQFPNEEDLVRFLSYLELSIMVLSLLTQTFVNERLIAMYGLKTALLVLPILLAILTLAAIFAGNIFSFTPNPENGFIWFFLFIALSKLVGTSLRESLENPTFKLFFMPLDVRVRFDIQAKVEGVVSEAARTLAGLIIIGLGALVFIELIHFSYFLILLIAGWIFITLKLYREYRNRVRLRLEDQKSDTGMLIETRQFSVMKLLRNSLKSHNPEKVIFAFKLLEKVNIDEAKNSVGLLINHTKKEIRKYGFDKVNEFRSLTIDPNVKKVFSFNDDQNNGENIEDWLQSLKTADQGKLSLKEVSKLSRSENEEERKYVTKLLGKEVNREYAMYLVELMRDAHPSVRTEAIQSAERLRKIELVPSIVENLNTKEHNYMAMQALVRIGESVFPYLESAFYKSGQSLFLMEKVIKTYELIGGDAAIQLLWNKIDFPNKRINSVVLSALGNMGFHAEDEQESRIKYAIENDIQNIAWNLHAIQDLKNTPEEQLIKEALYEENKTNYDHIYMLLSMLFEKQSIQLVKENIESQTNEGVSYAIELLDVLLPEDLKEKVIPALDDTSDSDKVRKLQAFFPKEIYDAGLTLKMILNRDFNQVNRWTKILTLRAIGMKREEAFLMDLIANIFNVDALIRETAAWALYQIDENAYEVNTQRINKDQKRRLDLIIAPQNLPFVDVESRSLQIQQILFMKQLPMFDGMSGLMLCQMVEFIEEIYLEKAARIGIEKSDDLYFYIVFRGIIDIYNKDDYLGTCNQKDLIGERILEESPDFSVVLQAREKSVLLRIEKDKFYDSLALHPEVSEKILNQISINFIQGLAEKFKLIES